MSTAQDAVAGALEDLDKSRRMLSRVRGARVRADEQRQFLRAIAFTWFHTRRPPLVAASSIQSVAAIDGHFQTILDSSERQASKATYTDAIKNARAAIITLRGALLAGTAAAKSSDLPPDFAALVSDTTMRDILARRWVECTRCIEGQAPLAATVMMGGLLEALLVARANRLADKSSLFKAKATPIDRKTQKALDLREWTLGPYIDVAHELGWLTQSTKDVAVVLRDYRNYVHPEKERSHGVTLSETDARMFWEVTKALSRQLLLSAARAAPGM